MKKQKILISVILIALLLSMLGGALAETWEEITDISGHWAEDVVKRGFEDGLLTGYDDGTVRPDDPITVAQMITVLTRVLGATMTGDAGALGINPEDWYYDAAGKALYLGLIDSSVGNVDAPMSRQDAFAIMAKAFSLTPARPDMSVLNSFSDSGLIKAANKPAMAALISAGLVQGSAGLLNANGNVSRAEFVTVLYRVAANYVLPYELTGELKGGCLVKGGGMINYLTTGENLWFDCSATSLYLNSVTGKNVTLRGHSVESLTIGSGTSLETLVIDCGVGSFTPGTLGGVTLNTLRYHSGTNLSLTDSVIKNVEITGSNLTAAIGGSHETLVISGSGNTVNIPENAAIGKIIVLGNGNKIEAGGVSAGDVEVTGSNNSITLKGEVSGGVTLSGKENVLALDTKNALGTVALPGQACWLTMSCPGIELLSITGHYSTVRKSGEGAVGTLSLTGEGNAFILEKESGLGTAAVTGANNKLTVDGNAESITLDGRNTIIDGSGSAVNLTINTTGCTYSIAVTNLVDRGSELEAERVLKMVTNVYKGNYTLQWAKDHNYTDAEKEIWVNAKGYSSRTKYLIWVNIGTQRVSVFTGSKGDWELERSVLCGAGAPGHATPQGTWSILGRQPYGWTTSTYNVRPVVNFYSSAYAFHSRLYDPKHNYLTDASIGFPVSHGCIRMYDQDVQFIYDSIPNGTTVVVY